MSSYCHRLRNLLRNPIFRKQFTTTEQATLQFNDLYALYRIKHGIPFPDEIKAIRTK